MARFLALSLFRVPQPAPRLQITQVSRFLSWDQTELNVNGGAMDFPVGG